VETKEVKASVVTDAPPPREDQVDPSAVAELFTGVELQAEPGDVPTE